MASIDKKELNKILLTNFQKLLDEKLNIDELEQTKVQEDLNIFNYVWSSLSIEKPQKIITDICLKYNKNLKAIPLFNQLLAYELLPEQFIKDIYELNTDKDLFYKSISSYKSLISVKNAGINIWTTIEIKNKQQFLPIYIWDKEGHRKDLKEKASVQDYFSFFSENKEKWFNFSKNIDNAQVHSSIAYLFMLYQKSKATLKKLKIKENQEHVYTNYKGNFAKISHLLLANGLIKLVDGKCSPDPLDLVKLVTSPVPQGSEYGYDGKFNQITNQKKFSELWFNYIKHTDFNFSNDFGNIANHTFKKKKPSFYIPLNKIDEQNNNFKTFHSIDEKNTKSLIQWLVLLDDKGVNFYHKNKYGISAICQLFNYICINGQDSRYFTNDSITSKIWKKSTLEQKKEVFKEFMSDWDNKLSTNIKVKFDQNYYSYQVKGNVENIIEIFLSDGAITEHEHIRKLYDFLSNYKEKALHIKEYCSELHSLILKDQLIEKDRKTKTAKI